MQIGKNDIVSTQPIPAGRVHHWLGRLYYMWGMFPLNTHLGWDVAPRICHEMIHQLDGYIWLKEAYDLPWASLDDGSGCRLSREELDTGAILWLGIVVHQI